LGNNFDKLSMRILIVGLNHQIQPRQITSGSVDGSAEAFEKDQKEHFGQLLRDLIRGRRVQFVGEETRHDQESIAQRACELERCQYANVELTPVDRQRRRIPPDYTNPRRPYTPQQRAEWNREREEYMTELTIAGAGGSERVLLLCGREHSTALAELFRQRGHEVETKDLIQEAWYIEDWFGRM